MYDPFIKADIERLQKQINIIKKMSESGWQIIYFTAKDEVRDVLKEDIDSKGWFDVYGEVDVGEVDSGVYELRVSVKDSRSNKTVQRTVVFSVE